MYTLICVCLAGSFVGIFERILKVSSNYTSVDANSTHLRPTSLTVSPARPGVPFSQTGHYGLYNYETNARYHRAHLPYHKYSFIQIVLAVINPESTILTVIEN